MNANNSVIKDFSKALRQAEDHVDLLRQQFFCLNLMKFFTEFPDVYDLGLFSHTCGYDNYILGPYINGKQEECQTTMFKYFEDTISYLDREQLEGMSGLIVKKDNIQAAWEKWMGEENYQKWKCLDMEDKLREHTKPLDESKQKRKRI